MLINGVGAWVIFRPLNEVLMYNGLFGIAMDLFLATVLITFFVTLFPIISLKRRLSKNNLNGMRWEVESRLKRLVATMPEKKAALIFMNILLAVLVFYMPSFWFINEVMGASLSGDSYFVFKTVYCTILATIVAYPVSYYAVTDRSSL